MSWKYQIDVPLDAPERTLIHKEIILSKPFLKKLYLEWYGVFLGEFQKFAPGTVVELGSGGGFLKELMPNIITSDIIPLPSTDMTFSALKMPFEDGTLDGLCMIDTFHHLPDARLFLSEANRTLKKNGKLIMIEPANTHWGRFIYSNFHHEPFYPDGSWQIADSGPLSGANGSLPWIVFIRDRLEFNRLYPELTIEQITFNTPLRYLLSGGVSFKPLVPDFSYLFFRGLDKFLVHISNQFAMFMTIKIKKNALIE